MPAVSRTFLASSHSDVSCVAWRAGSKCIQPRLIAKSKSFCMKIRSLDLDQPPSTIYKCFCSECCWERSVYCFPQSLFNQSHFCVNHDHSAMWNNVILRGSSILNHLLGFPSFCCATSIQIHPKLICWNLSLSSISGLLGVSLIHTRPWRRSVTERTGKGALVSPGWPREGWWSASTSWINFLVLRKSNSNSDSQITVQLICVEVS